MSVLDVMHPAYITAVAMVTLAFFTLVHLVAGREPVRDACGIDLKIKTTTNS